MKRRGGGARRPQRPPPRPWRSTRPSLDDPDLRKPGAGEAASIVARIPQVRAALLEFQRAFARRPPGAVLDGRDIGTVVCPDADVKIYVTATPEVRAERRYLEMQGRGEPATYEGVLADIRRRDERDAGREVVAHAAGRRRLLAGYQQFGYRSRIRYRRRCDPKEGRPARARLKARPNPAGTRLLRRPNHTIMGAGWNLGPAPRARQSPIRPPRPSREHVEQEQE